MDVEEEYIDAKMMYQYLGMVGTPTDPIENAKADIKYKAAKARFYKAEHELFKYKLDQADIEYEAKMKEASK